VAVDAIEGVAAIVREKGVSVGVLLSGGSGTLDRLAWRKVGFDPELERVVVPFGRANR
jgi:hypothetical protein